MATQPHLAQLLTEKELQSLWSSSLRCSHSSFSSVFLLISFLRSSSLTAQTHTSSSSVGIALQICAKRLRYFRKKIAKKLLRNDAFPLTNIMRLKLNSFTFLIVKCERDCILQRFTRKTKLNINILKSTKHF